MTTHAAAHPGSTRAPRAGRRGSSIGLPAGRTADLIRRIEQGLEFQSLRQFERSSGLPLAAIVEVIGIPERTLARRRASGRLSPEESERLWRLATVFEKATALFEGDNAAAARWMASPRKQFAGQTALAFSRTEIGAREVENLIGQLEHGVFA